ncbi:YeeE/YedE family protein [Pontibacter sp. SGAir0037]|uniref:YeeE/YedE family protein n=1 Tax=Pontibacter sp. SGAir0037 TaxID=2571030 RepID=UPI0010CD20CE|nr:YeeE/YedE thiosulfate transporter family protein [Pontibacter sp. SGAir0037]QCR21528.1 YeeE/YedE family protein [Pontibacter sp. SGAir0037]
MLEILRQPWPWYVSGPLIALVMVLLLFFGKSFGFSSNFRTICAACGAGKRVAFFNYNWREQTWNLLFLAGAIAGGWIASTWLASPEGVQIAEATVADLRELGLQEPKGLQPEELLGLDALLNVKALLLLLAGGFFIGFGSRYAGGCTSGHAISGLSNLQWPSLVAVIGFFIGGLITTYLLLPLLL